MKRTIIKIDETLCNGCGQCVNGCHEGALQLIGGKAVMISELYCDGLGACIGECPVDAITLEEREAEPYDELSVMERIVKKGETVVKAHLKHLKDHGQDLYYQIGIDYLVRNGISWKPDPAEKRHSQYNHSGGGCPGSQAMSFAPVGSVDYNQPSALAQWPVQLHLLSPHTPFLRHADLLLAADCVAFAVGNFHTARLQGKRLAIACPKLDSNKEIYVEKLTAMIDDSHINTLTVMIMEVPCCGGLLQLAQQALKQANRKIPLKLVVVSLQGEILTEEWV